ncbi:MAG: hypothetical protein V1798_03810 [Pseudomonadota bacterium]
MDPSQLERSVFSLLWKAFNPCRTDAYERGADRSHRSLREAARVSPEEVRRKVSEAGIVAVGGDALAPEDQEHTMTLLRWSRMRGRRAVFLTDRPFGPDGGTSRLIRSVRRRGLSVCAVSSDASLSRRDRMLVAELERRRKRGERVLLWTGLLRLAPDRLPKLMRRAGLDGVHVVLRAPMLRWRFETDRGWARAGGAFYCLGASPIATAHYHRAWHLHSQGIVRPEDLARTFYKDSRLILRKLRRRRELPAWKILHPFTFGFFRNAARGSRRTAVERFILDRCRRGESAVLPEQRLVFLSTVIPGELAEEAAHFVRSLDRRRMPKDPHSLAVEEAFGFMASRWVDPHREVPVAPAVPTVWDTVHRMGYGLGLALEARWRKSAKARAQIRKLWGVELHTKEDAREVLRALEALV